MTLLNETEALKSYLDREVGPHDDDDDDVMWSSEL